MSHGNGPELELKLNLSPPRVNPGVESPTVATSPPSSCVSLDMNQLLEVNSSSTSPDAKAASKTGTTTKSMLLVGCPRCLMYVMLSENEPKCPRCKSTVLLDFLHDIATTTTVNIRES
ncbi:hypothetical protein like AT3G11600 [Hibiscus trionum]|uniref:GIR1-like zinc ribbon domain-containing protein n=1 Tax=Hibiscus trionum TaxID=183268 RepID=A0A9W7GUC3_HIBTR|nr:hypothetical protein like AT3G11600 [Hibiscus trionum]